MEDTQKEKFHIAWNIRNLEIDLFWKRSTFFWVLVAAAFAGFAWASKERPQLALIISCIGFVTSVAWTLANRGSKYWQENWETKAFWVGRQYFNDDFLEYQEAIQRKFPPWLQARKFSVSKLSIALSDFACVLWLLLVAIQLVVNLEAMAKYMELNAVRIPLVGFTAGYAIYVWWCCRTG